MKERLRSRKHTCKMLQELHFPLDSRETFLFNLSFLKILPRSFLRLFIDYQGRRGQFPKYFTGTL